MSFRYFSSSQLLDGLVALIDRIEHPPKKEDVREEKDELEKADDGEDPFVDYQEVADVAEEKDPFADRAEYPAHYTCPITYSPLSSSFPFSHW